MKIDRGAVEETIETMKNEGFDYLVKITAVDYVKNIEVIYFLRNIDKNQDFTLEVDLDPSDLWIPTIIKIHRSADWYEREMSEMFGIEIKGRKAKRLLLEKWDGRPSPLRKNFVWGQPYES